MLDGKRVLVTGGAGFMGSHLAETLKNFGCSVSIADNFERGTRENIEAFRKKVKLFIVDLRDLQRCYEVVKRHDLVFHLAFKVGGVTYTGDPSYFSSIWSDGTRINMNVIESCVKAEVDKLLFTSSACVYPAFVQIERNQSIKEGDVFPAYPEDAYGWSKLMGELQVKWCYENYGLKSVILRPFNVYGEREFLDRRYGHALPVLCRKALEFPDYPFYVHGTGEKTRCFLYVRDMIEAYVKAMEKIEDATPINIGSEESTSVKELTYKIIALSDKDIKPVFLNHFPITGVNHRTPNIERAKRLLDWTPKTSLDDGLKKTYDWVETFLTRKKQMKESITL